MASNPAIKFHKQSRVEVAISLLMIFSLVFGVFFYDLIFTATGFSYTDEFIALVLVLAYIAFPKKRNKSLFIGTIAIISAFTFYLIQSKIIHIQPNTAILSDALILSKPFIGFFVIAHFAPNFSNIQIKAIRFLCAFGAAYCIALMIIGDNILVYFMGGPPRLATCATICGILYLTVSPFTLSSIFAFTIFETISSSTGKAKALGFMVLALTLIGVYYKQITKSSYRFRTRDIAIGVISILLVIIFAWDKIQFYAIQGIESDSMFARPALYLTSFEIARDHFPLGTGFGSFASFESGQFYSPIYDEYGISNIAGLTFDRPSYLADTFFPQLVGQFGVLGILLLVLGITKLIMSSYSMTKAVRNQKNLFLVVLIVAFFIIESTSDTTFTHNRGLFMMMLLGYIYGQIIHEYSNRNELELHAGEQS